MQFPPRRALAVLAAAVVASGLALTPAQSATGDEPVSLSVWESNQSGSQDVEAQPDVSLGSLADGAVNVRVDDSLRYEPYLGVGVSFTDSSGYLLTELKASNPSRYQELMTRIFSKTDGEGLSLWRIPMGASDFTHADQHWTNADIQGPDGDPLANFGLTSHDTDHIIPVIQDALDINPELRIMASPWTAPAWMKTNNSLICHTNGQDSELRPEFYPAWAQYFVEWIEAYEAEGIPIWSVTPQNEPQYCPDTYTGMSWTAAQQVDFVNNHLFPSLQTAGLSPVIFGFDHNFTYSSFAEEVIAHTDPNVIGGLAWHCYDNNADPAFMTKLHNLDPSRMVLETECSSDTVPTDIIRFTTSEMALQSFQNHARGVILWNLALEADGGPHLGGCESCLPVVTIDVDGPTADWSVHRNLPSLAQISRFVDDGAVRIDSTVNAHGISTAAFANPDGSEVLIATNPTNAPITFTVSWNSAGSFEYTLAAGSVVTFKGHVDPAPTLNPAPVAGGTYRIRSLAGKPIGVCAGATNDGACLTQWSDNGDADQRWTLADAGDGYFNIVNVKSGKALDVPNGTVQDGLDLQQWSITGSGNWNQQWLIEDLGGGWYRLVNRATAMAADLRDGSVSDGARLQQWTVTDWSPNQKFQFIPHN